jgi:hypothetical protein
MSNITRRSLMVYGAYSGAASLIGGLLGQRAFADATIGDASEGGAKLSLLELEITISANHGHKLILTSEQINSGEPVSLSIKGSSAHDHSITLDISTISKLLNGETVEQESTESSFHSHIVRIVPILGVTGNISQNHGHAATIDKSKFELNLEITGESDHTHTVALRLEDLIEIRDGRPLSLMTSTDFGHSHEVVFNGSDLPR